MDKLELSDVFYSTDSFILAPKLKTLGILTLNMTLYCLGTFLISYLLLGNTIHGYDYKRALPPVGKVTVYLNEDYKGASDVYRLPKWVCVDIDPSYIGHISSIYPDRDTCVNVFKNKGCSDPEGPTQLKEHDFGTDKLVRIKLNDKISSLKLC